MVLILTRWQIRAESHYSAQHLKVFRAAHRKKEIRKVKAPNLCLKQLRQWIGINRFEVEALRGAEVNEIEQRDLNCFKRLFGVLAISLAKPVFANWVTSGSSKINAKLK